MITPQTPHKNLVRISGRPLYVRQVRSGLIPPMMAKSFKDLPQSQTAAWQYVIVQPKLRGVRGRWSAAHQSFYSARRDNKLVLMTALFRNKLGLIADHDFEGEFHIPGLGEQQTINSAVKRESDDTSKIELAIFDLIEPKHSYAERLKTIRLYAPNRAVYHEVVKGIQDVSTLHDAMAQKFPNLEGLILRNPDGHYLPGPSDNVLKYKPFYETEGICQGTNRGTGKYAGQVGSLRVRFGDHIVNVSGLTDAQRAKFTTEPPVGRRLYFKYNELSKYGTPVSPRLVAFEELAVK